MPGFLPFEAHHRTICDSAHLTFTSMYATIMESQCLEEVPLPIPAPLKAHMEDDCFWILRSHRLLRLPRRPSVEDLLRQFYYHSLATAIDDTNPSLLAEVLDGIKIYFDFTLEDHLLYGPEREQLRTVTDQQQKTKGKHRHRATNSLHASHTKQAKTDSTTNAESSSNPTKVHLEHTPSGNPRQPQQPHLEHTPSGNPRQPQQPHLEHTLSGNQWQPHTLLTPSQIYGAEHLLRLFLKFPFFLSRAQIPSNHVQLLHHHFKELLGFLCAKRTELFLEENYDDVSTSGEDGGHTPVGESGEAEGDKQQTGSTLTAVS